MDLQLPVLRVLLAHPSGTTRKCIAEELNAALGDEVEVEAEKKLKHLLPAMRSRKLIRSEGRTWHITDDGGNHLAHEQQTRRVSALPRALLLTRDM